MFEMHQKHEQGAIKFMSWCCVVWWTFSAMAAIFRVIYFRGFHWYTQAKLIYDCISVVTSAPVIMSWLGLAHNQGEMKERPNQVLPDDFEDWFNLVKAVAQHMVDRHGLAEVSQWKWEVWVSRLGMSPCPNISLL